MHPNTTRWGRFPFWWFSVAGINADHIAVLAAISVHTNKSGVCVVSQGALAALLKRSRPWVNRVIGELANSGILEKQCRKKANSNLANAYYVNFLPTKEIEFHLQSKTGDETEAEWGEGARHQDDTPCHVGDAPCHVGDTIEQIKNNKLTPTLAREMPLPSHENHEKIIPPENWWPSPEFISRAEKICPGIDVESSIIHFISKSFANKYRYYPHAIGHAWLSWCIEDRTKFTPKATPSHRPSQERFLAWGLAAQNS